MSHSQDDVPPEVFVDLCSPTCLKRIVKYRHHNQTLIDDFNRITRANDVLIENEQIWKDKVKSLNETISELQGDLGDKITQINDLLTRFTATKKELADVQEKLEKSEHKLIKLHNASEVFNVSKSIDESIKKGLGFKAVPPPADYAKLPDLTKTVFVKPSVISQDPILNSAAISNSSTLVTDTGVKVEQPDMEKALKEDRISSNKNTSTSFCNDVLIENITFFDDLNFDLDNNDWFENKSALNTTCVPAKSSVCKPSNRISWKEKGKGVIFNPKTIASSSNATILKPIVQSYSTSTPMRNNKANKHKNFVQLNMNGKNTKAHVHNNSNLSHLKTKPKCVQNKFVSNLNKPHVPEVKKMYMTKTEAAEYRKQQKLKRKGFQKMPSKLVYVPKQKTELPKQKSKGLKSEKFILRPKNSSTKLNINPSELVLVKVRTYDLKGRPKTVTAWVSKSN